MFFINKEYIKSFKHLLVGKTIYQRILRIYLVTIFVGGVLLCLLPFLDYSKKVNFFDCLFISTSAFTNTGLSPFSIKDTFSIYGKIIILFLIQFGGIGFLTILIYSWALLSKRGKLSVEHRRFLHWERGSNNKVESFPTVKAGIIVLLFVEFVGAIILTFFFYYAHRDHKGDLLRSIWLGIFHSISASNNAGFDILGKNSITEYRNDENSILSVVLLIESILGGIGYPVFYDVYMYYKKKKNNERWYFSLFSKIAVGTYAVLFVLGALGVLVFEFIGGTLFTNASSASSSPGWGKNVTANKVWNIMYLSFSARSSGFSTINSSELTEATRFLLSVLMFVGASPASTGGGIRTITLFILFFRMFCTALGRKNLYIFNRTISEKIFRKACNVFVLSVLLVCVSILLILCSDPSLKSADIVFESTSAFGTAGLTSGYTEKSTWFGKVILMILMFVGQIGVSNALLSISAKHVSKRYVTENLRII